MGSAGKFWVAKQDVFDKHGKLFVPKGWSVQTDLPDSASPVIVYAHFGPERVAGVEESPDQFDRWGVNGTVLEPIAGSTVSPENRFLRLKFDGAYDNGDRYKDFELLADAPEIPAARSDVQPRHAIKGDVLRERADDTLTPFELRRAGKKIGDPEWWQVKHLFDGLTTLNVEPAEEPESTPSETPERTLDPVQLRFRSVVRGGLEEDHLTWRRSKGALLVGNAFSAREAIAGTNLRKGDYLVHMTQRGPLTGFPYPKAVSGAHVELVPRSHFEQVHEQAESFALVESGSGESEHDAVEGLKCYSGNKNARAGKDETSPLMIIRPYRSAISQPIEATSDAGAVFELLCQVGGRMPAQPQPTKEQ